MNVRFRANTCREIESCFVREIMSLAHAQGPSAPLSEGSATIKPVAALPTATGPGTFQAFSSTGNVPILILP